MKVAVNSTQDASHRATARVDSATFLVAYTKSNNGPVSAYIEVVRVNTTGLYPSPYGTFITISAGAAEVISGISLAKLDTSTYAVLYGHQLAVTGLPVTVYVAILKLSTDGFYTPTLGTPVAVTASPITTKVVWQSNWEIDTLDSTHVIIAWRQGVSSSQVALGTYSTGTTITVQYSTTFTTSNVQSISVAGLSSSKFAVAYVESAGANTKVQLGQVLASSLDVSIASVPFGSSSSVDIIAQGSSANRVLLGMLDSSNQGVDLRLLSVSFTSAPNVDYAAAPAVTSVKRTISVTVYDFRFSYGYDSLSWSLGFREDSAYKATVVVGTTTSNSVTALQEQYWQTMGTQDVSAPPNVVSLTALRLIPTYIQKAAGPDYILLAKPISLAEATDVPRGYEIWEYGQLYTWTARVAGSDPMTLQWDVDSPPSGATFSGLTNTLTWTPQKPTPMGSLSFMACETVKDINVNWFVALRDNCGIGYYAANNSMPCSRCADGTATGLITTTTATSCTTCSAGTYARNNEVCVACLPKYMSAAGVTTCTACAANQISTAGNTTCTTCASGKDTTNNLCTTCPVGTYSATGAVCTPCAAGTYNPTTGASACTSCSDATACAYAGMIAPTTPWSNIGPVVEVISVGTFNDSDENWKNTMYLAIAACAVVGILGIIVLIIWCYDKKKLRTLARLDVFYQLNHIVPILPAPVIKRRTIVGGMMSILALIGILALLEYNIYAFSRQNVLITDALLPDVASATVYPRIRIMVALHGYDAATGCVASGSGPGTCSGSTVDNSGITPTDRSTITPQCTMPNSTTCVLEWTCQSCQVDSSAWWRVYWTTDNAQAQGIRVQINTTSAGYEFTSAGMGSGCQTDVVAGSNSVFQSTLPALTLNPIPLYQRTVVNSILGTSATGVLMGAPTLTKDPLAVVLSQNATQRFSAGVMVKLVFDPQSYHRVTTLEFKSTALGVIGSFLGFVGGVVALFKFAMTGVEFFVTRKRGREQIHDEVMAQGLHQHTKPMQIIALSELKESESTTGSKITTTTTSDVPTATTATVAGTPRLPQTARTARGKSKDIEMAIDDT